MCWKEVGGARYGIKAHEFRKFMELPQHVRQTLEIALSIYPADARDLEALLRHRWVITDPITAASTPGAFRNYIQESGGECSVAQGMYVDTNSGWFSDRTVRYLASGKPALVQETGFSKTMPSSEGLVPFTNMEEAIAGAASIADHYDAHACAARRLAERYFDSTVVIEKLIDDIGGLS